MNRESNNRPHIEQENRQEQNVHQIVEQNFSYKEILRLKIRAFAKYLRSLEGEENQEKGLRVSRFEWEIGSNAVRFTSFADEFKKWDKGQDIFDLYASVAEEQEAKTSQIIKKKVGSLIAKRYSLQDKIWTQYRVSIEDLSSVHELAQDKEEINWLVRYVFYLEERKKRPKYKTLKEVYDEIEEILKKISKAVDMHNDLNNKIKAKLGEI